MQTLFKKTFLNPLPKSATIKTKRGQQVAIWIGKGGKERTAPVVVKADGSKAVRLERKTWVARFRDSDGIIRERSTGCTTKAAANVKLSEFVKESERIAAGVMTKAETELADWRYSVLTDAIAEYGDYLRGKGNAAKRIKTTDTYLQTDAAACDFKLLGDLNPDRLQRHLDSIPSKTNGPATLNQHVAAWVAFGNWLAGKRIRGRRPNWNGEKRLEKNPFDGFGKYDERGDCRRERRAMNEDELRRLLTVAAERPLKDARTIRRGDNAGKLLAKVKPENVARLQRLGRERALLYKTLVLTGLRKGELASITVGQCRLDVERPYIDLNAGDEKNGSGNDIPLRDDLAAELRDWIADQQQQPTDIIKIDGDDQNERLLFNVPAGLVRILNRDLTAAGIDKKDERGRTIDVHALRHSFGTMLSTSGVAPRIAQRAMRHSKIDLTMNTYTDPQLLDVHRAVNAMPSLDLPIENQATGTDDSNVVSQVSQVSHISPDLRNISVPSGKTEPKRLVSPMVSPRSCPDETIQVVSGGLGDSDDADQKRRKLRENACFPELFKVDPIGIEPTTSTLPVWRSPS